MIVDVSRDDGKCRDSFNRIHSSVLSLLLLDKTATTHTTFVSPVRTKIVDRGMQISHPSSRILIAPSSTVALAKIMRIKPSAQLMPGSAAHRPTLSKGAGHLSISPTLEVGGATIMTSLTLAGAAAAAAEHGTG